MFAPQATETSAAGRNGTAGMIRRGGQRETEDTDSVDLKGYDDFEIRLGDQMRGERATMGKSLMDVQRELRIKAAYIAAIENADPSAFDTPGFIAGYVRSYARYLNMDPDETFEVFCRESGFTVAHGMSMQASSSRRAGLEKKPVTSGIGADPFTSPNTPFIPESEKLLDRIEPRAIGSMLVLLGVIGAIGYGGWSFVRQIQLVQMAPVQQATEVLTDLDPVVTAAGGLEAPVSNEEVELAGASPFDRIYRPDPLEVPVLEPRDGPISTLDPFSGGVFAPGSLPTIDVAENRFLKLEPPARNPVPKVVEDENPNLRMVAVRPSWVRVSAANGGVIFEGIMEGGQTYEIPAMEEAPLLRAGESGAIYFALGGQHYGPVGEKGQVTKNLPLSIASVTDRFTVADISSDRDLERAVALAGIGANAEPSDP